MQVIFNLYNRFMFCINLFIRPTISRNFLIIGFSFCICGTLNSRYDRSLEIGLAIKDKKLKLIYKYINF